MGGHEDSAHFAGVANTLCTEKRKNLELKRTVSMPEDKGFTENLQKRQDPVYRETVEKPVKDEGS
jgi:hypothetical protein